MSLSCDTSRHSCLKSSTCVWALPSNVQRCEDNRIRGGVGDEEHVQQGGEEGGRREGGVNK